MVRPGNVAAVNAGMKNGRGQAQRSRAMAAGMNAISTKDTRWSEDATSASKNPASKETRQSEDSPALFAADKDSRRKDQHTQATSREQQPQQGQQQTTDSCSRSELCSCKACFSERLAQITESSSSAARCSCGALFPENARFCEVCRAPHPSVARAENRSKDASRPRSPALQRSAVQAAQRQNSLSSSCSTDKVSQGCTGCSMM